MGATHRSSQEWADFTGIVVYDPDGWDRLNFEASWSEPITFNEFIKRASMSTVDLNSFKPYMS